MDQSKKIFNYKNFDIWYNCFKTMEYNVQNVAYKSILNKWL